MNISRACRSVLLGASVLALSACLQLDQALPFELEEGAAASKTIGSDGGIISVPPDFAVTFPAGAISGSATVGIQRRLTSPFPDEAGEVLPGTAYDVTPAGLVLGAPATVEVRVANSLVDEDDQVRLAVAVLNNNGSVSTSTGTYDVTAGLLRADVASLGPMAAVVELDAIDVDTGLPPTLGGGDFGGTPSGTSGPSGAESQGQRFTSRCTPSERRCFSSGLIRAWVSQNLVDRLGDALAFVSPTVITDIDFTAFDGNGQPTAAIGSVTFQGKLKARVGQTVATYDVDEVRVTGGFAEPTSTGVIVTGNTMVLQQTSDGFNTEFEYGLTRIGTGELLTLRIEEEIDLENDDGSTTTGTVAFHVRLRR